MDPIESYPSNRTCLHTADPLEAQTVKSLKLVLSLSLGLAGLEWGLGWISHSLTVLADAGHLMTDSWVMGLVLMTAWLRLRSAQSHHQLESWVTLANGLVLVSVGFGVGWEAIQRFQDPPLPIAEQPMLLAATLNLAVNSLNAWILHQHSHRDHNVKAIGLHLLSDACGSLGILVAAFGIWQWQWFRADNVVSLGLASLIIYSALPLIIKGYQDLVQPKKIDRTEAVKSY